MEKYAGLILAAGKGTRMNEGVASPIPKVMFELAGKPIIGRSVDVLKNAGIDLIAVIVGYKKELIKDYLGEKYLYPEQNEQLGTGHAVMEAKSTLEGKSEAVIIFYGDTPLYQPTSVRRLIDIYEKEKPTIAIMTVNLSDPNFLAFGRIIRNSAGEIIAIKEQRDCTEDEKKIREASPGFYIVDAKWLWGNINKISNNNVQKEYYLTDIITMAVEQGKKIGSILLSDENEAIGINSPEQLKKAEEVLKMRQ